MIFILVGAICGYLTLRFLDDLSVGADVWALLVALTVLIVFLCASYFLQILLHEAGHLIFGLMTGYRFLSFRIGSLMWAREDGRLKLSRLSLTGIGGQCLMVPPETEGEKSPYLLYNMGGVIVNAATGAAFLAFYPLSRHATYAGLFCLSAGLVGLVCALLNGIPMRLNMVNNDGFNALSISKSAAARRAFWLQLTVNAFSVGGRRLREMPAAWFSFPSEEDLKNSMAASLGVLACCRLMDCHSFEEADRLTERLLGGEGAVVGLHRGLLICDRIYCELVTGNRRERLDALLDRQQQKFMKSMIRYPSVLRTQYAYALLAENDLKKADAIRAQFDNGARVYPYDADIASERELLDIAARKADRPRAADQEKGTSS